MKRLVATLMLLIPALALGQQPDSTQFLIRIRLLNSHLRELFFGCAAGATPGYDRARDDFAPPPGIATGYSAFLPPVDNLPHMYKDIRGPAPIVTWRLLTRVHAEKAIQLDWDPELLPRDYRLVVKVGKKQVDMRRVKRLEIKETVTLEITATRQVGQEGRPPPETDKGQE